MPGPLLRLHLDLVVRGLGAADLDQPDRAIDEQAEHQDQADAEPDRLEPGWPWIGGPSTISSVARNRSAEYASPTTTSMRTGTDAAVRTTNALFSIEASRDAMTGMIWIPVTTITPRRTGRPTQRQP